MEQEKGQETLPSNPQQTEQIANGAMTGTGIFLSLIMFLFGLAGGLFSGYSYANSINLSQLESMEQTQQVQDQDTQNLPISQQFALSRDSQRLEDLNQIAEAVLGVYIDTDGTVPDMITAEKKVIASSTTEASLSAVLLPDYLDEIPYDPNNGSPTYTGYSIYMPAETVLVLEAQSEANPGKKITVVKELDLDSLMR